MRHALVIQPLEPDSLSTSLGAPMGRVGGQYARKREGAAEACDG